MQLFSKYCSRILVVNYNINIRRDQQPPLKRLLITSYLQPDAMLRRHLCMFPRGEQRATYNRIHTKSNINPEHTVFVYSSKIRHVHLFLQHCAQIIPADCGFFLKLLPSFPRQTVALSSSLLALKFVELKGKKLTRCAVRQAA